MTKEQEIAKRYVDNYINLKKAIDDPNYPSTAHTLAILIKVENKIKQLNKNHIFHLVFNKLMPNEYNNILK
jgi:Tfp pilus assembly protein PilF